MTMQSLLLEKKLDILSIKIVRKSKKYFHLRSVQNFVHHFEKISNENDKLWILKNLNNYLESCESYINSIDRNISKDLYLKYLDKIGDYYRENLNFTLYTSFDILLILFTILLLTSSLFLNLISSLFLITSCFLIYIFYLMYKKKHNKTFGFFH